MELLSYIGIGLIVLSALSGIAIYLFAFNKDSERVNDLALLFILSLLGGSILYSIGENSRIGVFYSSLILLLLGCLSVITIFLGEIDFFRIKNKTSLWYFFLLGIPIGVGGLYHKFIISYLF